MSWDTIAVNFYIVDICVTSKNNAYSLRRTGNTQDHTMLYRSKDGGYNWDLVQKYVSPYPTTMLFINDSTGLYLDYSHVGSTSISRTEDYGKTFNSISGLSYGAKLVFINDTTCYQLAFGSSEGYADEAFVSYNTGKKWYKVPISEVPDTGYHDSYNGYFVKKLQSYNAYYISPLIGVGSEGPNVYRTENGGVSWTKNSQQVLSPNFFTDAAFPELNTGYLLDAKGHIFKSLDKGKSWLLHDTSTARPGTKILFNKNLNGFIFGTDSYIYRSESDSKKWQPIRITDQAKLLKISFPGKDTGYALAEKEPNAIGAKLQLFKTIDGGLTWKPLALNSSNSFSSMDFANGNIGFITTYSEILKTTNGGLTWTSLSTPESAVYSYTVKNEANGFLNAGNSLYATENGGLSWKLVSAIENFYLNTLLINSSKTKLYYYPLRNDTYFYGSSDGGKNFKKALFTSQKYNWVKLIDDETMLASIDGNGLFLIENLSCAIDSIKTTPVSAVEGEINIIGNYYIYPNPLENKGSLKFPENSKLQDTYNLYVYDCYGTQSNFLILSNKNNYDFELTDITPGIYYFSLQSENGVVIAKNKFVVK